jgi:hypothetical protein
MKIDWPYIGRFPYPFHMKVVCVQGIAVWVVIPGTRYFMRAQLSSSPKSLCSVFVFSKVGSGQSQRLGVF